MGEIKKVNATVQDMTVWLCPHCGNHNIDVGNLIGRKSDCFECEETCKLGIFGRLVMMQDSRPLELNRFISLTILP